MDVETGKELARYTETSPATAMGEGILVDRGGQTIAVAFDAGNRMELRLLEARTLKLRSRVDLPLGRGLVSAFSDDGERLAVSWSTPDRPSEIYSVSAATGRATALRSAEGCHASGATPPARGVVAEAGAIAAVGTDCWITGAVGVTGAAEQAHTPTTTIPRSRCLMFS